MAPISNKHPFTSKSNIPVLSRAANCIQKKRNPTRRNSSSVAPPAYHINRSIVRQKENFVPPKIIVPDKKQIPALLLTKNRRNNVAVKHNSGSVCKALKPTPPYPIKGHSKLTSKKVERKLQPDDPVKFQSDQKALQSILSNKGISPQQLNNIVNETSSSKLRQERKSLYQTRSILSEICLNRPEQKCKDTNMAYLLPPSAGYTFGSPNHKWTDQSLLNKRESMYYSRSPSCQLRFKQLSTAKKPIGVVTDFSSTTKNAFLSKLTATNAVETTMINQKPDRSSIYRSGPRLIETLHQPFGLPSNGAILKLHTSSSQDSKTNRNFGIDVKEEMMMEINQSASSTNGIWKFENDLSEMNAYLQTLSIAELKQKLTYVESTKDLIEKSLVSKSYNFSTTPVIKTDHHSLLRSNLLSAKKSRDVTLNLPKIDEQTEFDSAEKEVVNSSNCINFDTVVVQSGNNSNENKLEGSKNIRNFVANPCITAQTPAETRKRIRIADTGDSMTPMKIAGLTNSYIYNTDLQQNIPAPKTPLINNPSVASKLEKDVLGSGMCRSSSPINMIDFDQPSCPISVGLKRSNDFECVRKSINNVPPEISFKSSPILNDDDYKLDEFTCSTDQLMLQDDDKSFDFELKKNCANDTVTVGENCLTKIKLSFDRDEGTIMNFSCGSGK